MLYIRGRNLFEHDPILMVQRIHMFLSRIALPLFEQDHSPGPLLTTTVIVYDTSNFAGVYRVDISS